MSRHQLSAEDEQRIAARYPPPRVSKRAWVVIATVLVVLSSGIYAWVATFQASQIGATVRGFTTQPDRVDGLIDVYRPDPTRSATCTVFALAENFERVGEIRQLVPPSEVSEVTVEVSVLTYRRATALDVEGCRSN